MTDARQALLGKARRAIQSARLLQADGDYDSAVSRAYYAMFYVAEALLLSKGLTFSKHSAVIAAFGREFAKTGEVPERYHRYLVDAEEDRNVSDYQPVSHMSGEAARLHISRAEEFLAAAEHLLGS